MSESSPKSSDEAESKESNFTAGTVGIANFSNMCFTSAVLQVLNHCGPLVALFDSMVVNLGQYYGEHYYEQDPRKQHAKMLIKQYFMIQRELWRKKAAVDSTALLRTMQEYNSMFDGTTQQDTHEFLNALLDYLHEGLLYFVPDSLEPSFRRRMHHHHHFLQQQEQPSEQEQAPKRAKPRAYRRSAISEIFEGSLCTTVVCINCGHQSHNIEHFYDLSLPIPSKKQLIEEAERVQTARQKLAQTTQPNTPISPAELVLSQPSISVDQQTDTSSPSGGTSTNICSVSFSALSDMFGSVGDLLGWNTPALALNTCLESFFAPEPLSDHYRCDQCKTASEAVKTVGIARYPQILVLHMKRFRSVGMWHSKLHTQVNFPDKTLDMRSYFVETKQYTPVFDAAYDLFGVIQHQGGMNGGHYVAYVRHLVTGDWYEYDDTAVRRVTFEFVKAREAYLLFYGMHTADASTEDLRELLMKYIHDNNVSMKPSVHAAQLHAHEVSDAATMHVPLPRLDAVPPMEEAQITAQPAPEEQASNDERHRSKKAKHDDSVSPQGVDMQMDALPSCGSDGYGQIFISRQWAFRMLQDSRLQSPCNHDVACPHGRIKPHLASSGEHLLLPIQASDYFDIVSHAFGEKDKHWAVAHEHSSEEELAGHTPNLDIVRFVHTPTVCDECSQVLKQRQLQRMTERQMVTSAASDADVDDEQGDEQKRDDHGSSSNGSSGDGDNDNDDANESTADDEGDEHGVKTQAIGNDAAVPSAQPTASRKMCIVHKPWMKKWWRYCNIDFLEDIDRLVQRPGPVSNERLFDQGGKLLPNLEFDVHYTSVSPEVYEALVQLYGGGPEIVRYNFDIYSSCDQELSDLTLPEREQPEEQDVEPVAT